MSHHHNAKLLKHRSPFLVNHLVPLDDVLVELDHEGRSLVPVGADLGGKVGPDQDGLDDAGHEIQGPFVLGHLRYHGRSVVVHHWVNG